jgi:hypothetical protein
MFSWRLLSKRSGLCLAGVSRGAPRARVALLIGAALVLGGCSSVAPLPNSGLISAFASSAPARAPLPPIDVEADGMEEQRPPPMRMYSRPDDPTQPFSPNYGSVPLDVPDDGEESPVAPTKEAAIRGEHPI